LADDPVPPTQLQPVTPRDLETICLKCLHKEPGRRYATAADLAEDLRRWQAGEPITARPVGVVERTVKWVRRRPAAAGVLAVSAAALLALLLGGAWVTQQMAERNAAAFAQKQAEEREAEAHSLRERAERGEAEAREERNRTEQERQRAEREREAAAR